MLATLFYRILIRPNTWCISPEIWGDWIHLYGCRSGICIECTSGICRAATIEHGEGEEDGEPVMSILHAFGWHGIDDNGEYPLVSGTGN